MGGGATFAEVLDETLAGPWPRARAVAGSIGTVPLVGARLCSRAGAGWQPSTLQRETPSRPVRHAAYVALVEPQEFVHDGPAHRRPALPDGEPFRTPGHRPSRTLSAGQQQALAELVRLGATLDADFSETELRRAFRQLARRYHPDRHADRSVEEQARAATVFRRLYDNYTTLRRAVRSDHRETRHQR